MNLDDKLMADAMRATGIREKTALVHHSLKKVVQDEAYRRLAELGGTQPHLKPFRRKRYFAAAQ